MDEKTALILGSLLGGIVTPILTYLTLRFNARETARKLAQQREWDLEDRRLAREELKRETAEIGAHVAKRVVQAEETVAKKVSEAEHRADTQRNKMLAKIDEHAVKLEEVKVASKAAETVANHSNEKIARLIEIYDQAGRRAATEKADVVQEIKDIGEDTNVRVQDVQKKIDDVSDQVHQRVTTVEQHVVEEIKQTGDDTNVRVKGIEKKVEKNSAE